MMTIPLHPHELVLPALMDSAHLHPCSLATRRHSHCLHCIGCLDDLQRKNTAGQSNFVRPERKGGGGGGGAMLPQAPTRS